MVYIKYSYMKQDVTVKASNGYQGFFSRCFRRLNHGSTFISRVCISRNSRKTILRELSSWNEVGFLAFLYIFSEASAIKWRNKLGCKRFLPSPAPLLIYCPRAVKTENPVPPSFFFGSETKRRRLLRRLLDVLLSHDIFYLYSFKISMFPVFMPFWGSYLINF